MNFFKNNEFYKLWKEKRYKDALHQPIEPPKSKEEKLSHFLFGNNSERTTTFTVATLSIGDFLYDYIRIDPTVIEAVDFARSDNIDSIFSFSEFSVGMDVDSVGDISQLQGYVAEKMLAMELTAKGHEVEFPEESNEPGWDILVDGEKFQVKNLSDPSGVYEHLNKYPEYPVYVNADLGETFAGNPNVFIAENIHHEEIVSLTKEQLILGQELQDFEIPLLTLLVSSAINVKGLMKKESDIKNTVTNIITDTASRSLGGYVGQYGGSLAGGVLFGPAGVIVIGGAGAFLGMAQGGKLAGVIKRIAASDNLYRFRRDLTMLIDTVLVEIPKKLERRQQQWLSTKEKLFVANAPIELIESFEAKYQDDKKYLENKNLELQRLRVDINNRDYQDSYRESLTQILQTGVHPSKYQKELKACNSSLEELVKNLRKKGLT
ncbi:hypothetical protein ACERII_23815 [Evansella sp. AB-rgal1]|uniref:hypothetical protein n=1 Tax=Evansella sp. AB-rgal1 TaxID=3242696 RepID=UPI00359CF185